MRRTLTSLALALVASSSALPRPPGLLAQEAGARAETGGQGAVGALLVAHGGSEEWNARVHAIASEVRIDGPVDVGFLMGPLAAEHRFQDAVASLRSRGAGTVVVVPVLVSSHSGHYEQIRWLAGATDTLSETMRHHLHEAGIARPAPAGGLLVTPALDASMELAPVLAARALALAEDPPTQALFLVGHGPTSAGEYAEWMRNLRPVADSVARLTGFRDVKLGLLRDDAPPPIREEAVRGIREIVQLQHDATGGPVVVVPILISKGYISTTKLPGDLGGLPIAYDGEGLLPHPTLARWVERRVREAVAGSVPIG